MARVGIITFPGTNCERETLRAFASVAGVEALPLWHRGELEDGLDLIVLPGGFSYGDYLRAGSVARFSPLMEQVIQFAHEGGYVLGICNGFQILAESGLLPGALIRNRNLRFISRNLTVRVERTDVPWTCACTKGQLLTIPVAHGDGNYVDHAEDFAQSDEAGQVLLRYCDSNGELTDAANPNGSMGHTAGIMNAAGNVFGLMPHPERAMTDRVGGGDGRILLQGIVQWVDDHSAGEESE